VEFSVGDRVHACWKGPENAGEWYYGKTVTIDEKAQTAHVRYDDGDEDPVLPWIKMRIQSEKFKTLLRVRVRVRV